MPRHRLIDRLRARHRRGLPTPATVFVRLKAFAGARRLVWVVPLVALAVSGYLISNLVVQRGPSIAITFPTSEGIKVGTKIEHKAVELGRVQAVDLTGEDANKVVVHVQMQRTAEPFLTENAKFWVSRLNLSGGAISGLQSILSGSFIAMDPGSPSAKSARSFTGLPRPPARRYDQPGTTYTVTQATNSGLSVGAGVYYRDQLVGEVLDTELTEASQPIRATFFVRSPWDGQVRTGSVFWQQSGAETRVTNDGLHFEVVSLPALASGGIAFDLPSSGSNYPPAHADTVFPLFATRDTAIRASYDIRLPFSLSFASSIAGLDAGSPVMLLGNQVGEVTGVGLSGRLGHLDLRARVQIVLLPQSLQLLDADVRDPLLAQHLVEEGMQAQLETVSYFRNSKAISLTFKPPGPRSPTVQDGVTVMPTTESKGTDDVVTRVRAAISVVLGLPLDRLGTAVEAVVSSVAAKLNGVPGSDRLRPIVAQLEQLRAQIRDADAKVPEMLRKLTPQEASADSMLQQANDALRSIDDRYGRGSGLQGQISYQLDKYYGLTRRTAQLANYLGQHPEAVVRGTTGRASER